jgi:toxin ParE1/3/4
VAKVRVSGAALNDIREIGRFTQTQWGPERRRAYLAGLDQKFSLLADNPEISPERAEFDPPVRIQPHERHLVVYIVEKDGILIVRVLHGSMDIAPHLSQDE